MFYSLCINAVSFLGDKFFPVSLEVIYMHGFMLFLGINCCLGLIFIAFMDETSGKSIDTVNQSENHSPVNKSSPIESSLRNHLRGRLSNDL